MSAQTTTQAVPDRALTILIAAMGGEGGGGASPLGSEGGRLLLRWLTAAAGRMDFPVQSTLMPGTTQRTASTTYYVEIFPAARAALGGREPVLRLTARPGDVDVLVAYELLEAARVMQAGYAHAARTTLVASTHRAYTVLERASMTDGRFDADKALEASRACTRQALWFDMAQVAREIGCGQHAVVLGAIAASGVLPIAPEVWKEAIAQTGVSVQANQAGFEAGLLHGRRAAAQPVAMLPPAPVRRRQAAASQAGMVEAIEACYPAPLARIVREGALRVLDHQDQREADAYLDKVRAVFEREQAASPGAHALTQDVARHLALWMSYEDVIRVADLKSRAERFQRVREEVGAGPDDRVEVVEFLKPGIEELASVMPAALGRHLVAWAEARGWGHRFNVGLHVRSTSIHGLLMLRMIAALRPLRRLGYRYAYEHGLIARWLGAVEQAAGRDLELAGEIAQCARIVKGYSDTRRRAIDHFGRIFGEVVEPALQGGAAVEGLAAQVRRLRTAALDDPDGHSLARALDAIVRARTPHETDPHRGTRPCLAVPGGPPA